jgi:hypothetical protein
MQEECRVFFNYSLNTFTWLVISRIRVMKLRLRNLQSIFIIAKMNIFPFTIISRLTTRVITRTPEPWDLSGRVKIDPLSRYVSLTLLKLMHDNVPQEGLYLTCRNSESRSRPWYTRIYSVFDHIFSLISMWYHSCDNFFFISHCVFLRHALRRIKSTKTGMGW